MVVRDIPGSDNESISSSEGVGEQASRGDRMPSRVASLVLDGPLVSARLCGENPAYQLFVLDLYPYEVLCQQGWREALPGCSVPGICHISISDLFHPCIKIHLVLYLCKSFCHCQ